MALSGIGANTLRGLGAAIKPLLTDQCVVKRPAHVSDGAFGHSDTLAAIGTFACQVDTIGRRGGNEDDDQSRVTVEDRYLISFLVTELTAAGATINPQDQITQASSGITYVVTNNIDAVTSAPVLAVNAAYASK